MKVCAGIVLFNPEIDKLKQNIAAISNQVDTIVLLDNASDNAEEIQEQFNEERFIWIRNEKNLGVATGLNQIINYAAQSGFKWVLTLDQDSVCGEQLVEKLLAVGEDGEENNIAMVSPQVIEQGLANLEDNTEAKLAVNLETKPVKQLQEEKVSFCITSGCLTNVSAIQEIGGFNDWLFIDFVDYEMCIRLRHKGYQIIKINTAELYQEYGLKTVSRRIFHKKYIYHNYTPHRVYYQARNTMYMLRKYGADFKPNPFLQYFRPIITFSVKFIFEPKRFKRLSAFTRGYFTGLFMKIR